MSKERWALISVFAKEGIVEFAQGLVNLGIKILASGGTAKALKAAGIEVKDVADLVGGAAMLNHRVVTLSREVHAGLLARYVDKDIAEMEGLGLPYIDIVCVDFYPLQAEIDKPGSTPASVLEQTDIGGPTMIRSGAKGRRIIICDPADRKEVLRWLSNGEPDRDKFAIALAAKGEFIVAQYCTTSAIYWGDGEYGGILGKRVVPCKYGENAYQAPAALYRSVSADDDPLSLDKFVLVDGSSPSYNNLCDLDRLIQTATHIVATFQINIHSDVFIALGAKHGNVCGAAIHFHDRGKVIEEMLDGDPLAIFGGLVLLNFAVDEEVAEVLLHFKSENRRILDGIIAPSFNEKAVEKLGRKGGKCRLLANPVLANLNHGSIDRHPILRSVRGGFLLQPNYTFILDLKDQDLGKYGHATPRQEFDMLLAKAICDTSNSNTITLVKDCRLIGNGTGQQSRIAGAELAIDLAHQSGHEVSGAAAASDSFFPFTDGPQYLINSGVGAIIGTSGSVKDSEVICLCQDNSIPIYLIPDAKGRGFFNH